MKVPNLASLNDLNRRVVKLVEIDIIGLQALEAFIYHQTDVGGRKVPAAALRANHDVPALCGEDDFAAPSFQRLAQQRLRIARSVGIRGVDEVHPEIERGIDGSHRILIARRPEVPRMHHGPQSDRAYAQTRPPKNPVLHRLSPLSAPGSAGSAAASNGQSRRGLSPDRGAAKSPAHPA